VDKLIFEVNLDIVEYASIDDVNNWYQNVIQKEVT